MKSIRIKKSDGFFKMIGEGEISRWLASPCFYMKLPRDCKACGIFSGGREWLYRVKRSFKYYIGMKENPSTDAMQEDIFRPVRFSKILDNADREFLCPGSEKGKYATVRMVGDKRFSILVDERMYQIANQAYHEYPLNYSFKPYCIQPNGYISTGLLVGGLMGETKAIIACAGLKKTPLSNAEFWFTKEQQDEVRNRTVESVL
jgi:hypothetical protein